MERSGARGRLFLVGTPIGNLDDLGDRARDILRSVARVYAEDTRRTGRLLEAIGADVPLRSLHEHNEAERSAQLAEELSAGRDCALVSDAGMPVVSDPGRRAVDAAWEAGARVIPVPGPTAASAALAASGLSGDRYAFLGFPPRSGREREEWLQMVGRLPLTVVLYESPRRVTELLSELEGRGLGERRTALCRELTKLHEEVRRGTVSGLAGELAASDEDLRGEVTLVLEGRESGDDWRERLPEARERARELAAVGRRTKEISAALQRDFGVPRNEAYEMALEAGREEPDDG